MHIWTQNLNDSGKTIGSILFHGRGHISRKPFEGLKFGAEWLLFHRVKWQFGVSFQTGHSDGDDGFLFMLKLPWLFALYLYVDGICQVKEGRTFDFYISDQRIKLCPWGRVFEWNSSDPWWVKGWSWDLPWATKWLYTKVLTHDGKGVVWMEHCRDRRKGDGFKRFDERQAHEAAHSRVYPYRYVLKSGEVQERIATVHLEEMAWGYKWWPFPVNVKRSIDVKFDAEVGEGTGSWKGGCVGSGYTMLSGETAEECLRRMERERKFDR